MRVLIVDDHPLFVRGLESLLLELDPCIETLCAGSISQALTLAEDSTIDLVLLDLNLPGLNNLDALKRIREELPSTPAVVVSANEDEQQVWKAIERGAAGYIPKTADQGQMVDALRSVLACGTYVPQHALLGDMGPNDHAPPTFTLSTRQREVLKLLLQGKSNKVIAHSLGIAEGTTKAHLFSIYQTLGVNSRTQAMSIAHQHRLIEGL